MRKISGVKLAPILFQLFSLAVPQVLCSFAPNHLLALAANVKLGVAGALPLAGECAQFSYPFHLQWGW